MKFSYWMSPLGWTMGALLACGTWAAVLALLRRIGIRRQVQGRITSLKYYSGVRAIETEIEVPHGWPGHRPGQFAFATSDISEGAHPYTIASGWNAAEPRITFITKELGDHTSRLREKLRIGQEVKVEGPYGCFTFDDECSHQIWIGGGIGITAFVARMKQMAMQKDVPNCSFAQVVDLFHTTADVDEEALGKLAADARSANVRLHILVDARDGQLTGQGIREAVPNWRKEHLVLWADCFRGGSQARLGRARLSCERKLPSGALRNAVTPGRKRGPLDEQKCKPVGGAGDQSLPRVRFAVRT